jgi:hypothetical protein
MSLKDDPMKAFRVLLIAVGFLGACNVTTTVTTPIDHEDTAADDVTRPTVMSVYPVNGATAVAATTRIVITFAGPIAFADIEANSLLGAAVGFELESVEGNEATFRPSRPMSFGTTYELTVMTSTHDLESSHLENPYSWSFSIEEGTNVGGIYSSDQHWTYENSPYFVESTIQIAYGATLSIDPGVHVLGADAPIQVFGHLQASGLFIWPVVFENVQIEPGTSDGDSQPFLIDISFAKFMRGRLYGATGNGIYGSLELRDSVVENLEDEMHLWYPAADCVIERNIFVDSAGISVGTSESIQVLIMNNVFIAQKHGFAVQNWASYDDSATTVRYNSFLSTDRIAVGLQYSSAAMDATENWWNTTNEATIASMIFDKNDDSSSAGFIPFSAYLSGPHVDTPDASAYLP